MSSYSNRTTIAILLAAVLFGVLAALLPDNPYQRYELLDNTIHRKARWIYERIHFDPAPIDVMIVGPSRVDAGVDGPRLEHALAARGVPSRVVNFSFPETGRDINLSVVEETLRTKRPKLIVLGIIEKPSRYGHSAFKYLARPGLVANPGHLVNFNWPANAVYLPFRQMKLMLARVAPGAMGLPDRFDAAAYLGSNIDTTGDVVMPDGEVREGDRPAALPEIMRGVRKLESGMNPPILPARYADIEFGDERSNIRRIVALARANGAKVAFLFVPYYSGTDIIQEEAFYRQYGPVWNGGFVAHRPDLFMDYGHLTSGGADVITDWLAPRVATTLQQGKPAT